MIFAPEKWGFWHLCLYKITSGFIITRYGKSKHVIKVKVGVWVRFWVGTNLDVVGFEREG